MTPSPSPRLEIEEGYISYYYFGCWAGGRASVDLGAESLGFRVSGRPIIIRIIYIVVMNCC